MRRFIINPRTLGLFAADAGDNATTGSAPAPVETNSEKPAPAAPPAPPLATPAVPTAPAASVAAPKLTILQSLNAAIASKAELQANLKKVTEERDSFKTLNATLKQERDGFETKLGAATAENIRLKGESATVAEKVAELGFPLDKLPAQTEATGADDPATIYSTWKSLSGGAKTAYFRQHEKVLENYNPLSQ